MYKYVTKSYTNMMLQKVTLKNNVTISNMTNNVIADKYCYVNIADNMLHIAMLLKVICKESRQGDRYIKMKRCSRHVLFFMSFPKNIFMSLISCPFFL